VNKPPDPPLSALTMAIVRLYFAFAGATALMLLWVLLHALSRQLASELLVLPRPPTALLLTLIILMMAARIAAAWAYRRDVRASQRSP
jgi:hypothetical protein